MTRRHWLALLLGIAALLLLGRAVAEVVVERRWYAALGPGALDVWRAREAALWLLRGLCAAVAAAVCFANLYGVVSSVEKVVLPRRLGDLEIGETVPGRRLLWSAAAISLAIGALLALPLDTWMPVVALGAGASFGEIEPFTGHDLAFHVHWLPLEHALYTWALFVLLAVGALVLACYALTPGLRIVRGRIRMSGHVRRHVTVLGVGLLLLLAWGHRLDAFGLLVAGSGEGGLFTYADHRIGLPIRFALAVLTGLSSLAVLRAGWAGQPRLAFWVVTGVLVVTFASRWLAPVVVTQLTAPDELTRLQASYAATRALYTRRAYAADAVTAAPAGYGLDSLAALSGATSVWDPAVLLRAMERLRRGGAAVGDVGWAAGPDGALRAIVVERPAVTPTEDTLPEFTVVTVDAVRTESDGSPLAVTSDSRPLSDAGRGVRVLVHPDAIGPAVMSDPAQGIVGDPVVGWGARLAHAWARRDLRLAFSVALERTASPELVLRRDPRERLRALVPFFTQGEAIYPALHADSLHWIVHLYAATDAYPLSGHWAVTRRERSYFQHAAVAIVNAQSGAVQLVADAAPGALARVWIRRFPGLFQPRAALPPDLAGAIPPPIDAVLVQGWVFAQYGARGATSVAPRRLSGGAAGDSAAGLAPRAVTLLPLPAFARANGDSLPPLARAPVASWTIPLLDAASRVDGALIAVGGAAPRTLWMPANGAFPRWPELTERMREVTTPVLEPARAAPEPNAPRPATTPPAGTVRGQLRALPVRGALTFLQPTYDQSRDAPAVAAVALATADSVRAGRSLSGVLGGVVIPGDTTSGTDRLGRARSLYDVMRQALQRGDWARFGAALDSLGAAVGARPR
ncbi:UPF0182 family protein [Roseisolibacter agri]|uniref:Uncharacterized protein n=1 Tax=Roseisolibacter agri TaxID=2014610 RepID=A0AA37V248_9BACT|nr:UPF0182 family protein [Roseisolibacter agri]GLC27250.1 hypothetical protein rosag_37630 [Roseisolibacter agri]